MNRSLIKLKLLMVAFFTVGILVAQKQTKVSQAIKVDKDVTIDLNTSHCNIVFDTWNKNEVNIEAYVEGDDATTEELQTVLKNWKVNVDASSNNINITSKGFGAPNVWAAHAPHHINIEEDGLVNTIVMELEHELADLPHVIVDGLGDLNMVQLPELPEMPPLPELPPLPKDIDKVEFDYDAYKKDGEAYLEKYNKEFEAAFGEDYAEKMEAWGKKFGEEWEKHYGKHIEEWAKNFEKNYNNEDFQKRMEAWGERFGKRMELKQKALEKAHAARERVQASKERAQAARERVQIIKEHRQEQREQLQAKREKLKEERKVLVEKLINKEGSNKVKKTIKIKMPKDAKLKVNIRHGEVEFASINDLKADISHSKLVAQSINGGLTSINASYSPVYVTNWNVGELNLNYARNVKLNNVKHVVLNANSSDVEIDNLIGNAIIDANIGDIKIAKIDDVFTNLNVILQNCDAIIALPKASCNLQYKGNRSRISHPKQGTTNVSTFSTGSLGSGKSIVVNAKYSNVTME